MEETTGKRNVTNGKLILEFMGTKQGLVLESVRAGKANRNASTRLYCMHRLHARCCVELRDMTPPSSSILQLTNC